ncbi:hypothetical protein [Desulfurispira natronophila]|uniref:Nucleotide-binding protein n=1 Tax=Desulfurispira natronophila TaxID=682562 RepID=A0A7W7Y637_9BACT|nr:hypothetical protein [Desulfurispira natronophila]MBB5022744.1 hypothetical protein [Desulfurispira natronophila]
MKNTFILPTIVATSLLAIGCNSEPPTEPQSRNGAQMESADQVLPEGHPPIDNRQPEMPAGHPEISTTHGQGFDFSSVEPLNNLSIANVYDRKDDLAGGEVHLRGKVVRYNANIMGTNWLHIQDGSGGPGTNDLTVTTDSKVQVGDIVTVQGVLTADKDFGHGYAYDLIIQNAKVTIDN